MKSFSLITISLFLLGLIWSCDVDKYNVDPNRPSIAEPQTILPNVLFQTFKNRYPWQPGLTVRHATATSDRQEFQTYEWNYGSWDEYNLLRDIEKIKERVGENKSYEAITLILRSYNFLFLTRMYGDIPYSNALLGEKKEGGVFQPKYDSQKEVFLGILKELEQANELLSNSKDAVEGDILFNGNLNRWRKLSNSLQLKVLLILSNQELDSDLQIKQKFNLIFSNQAKYPVFESVDDEVKISYSDFDKIRYPLFQDFNVRNKRFIGKVLADMMKNLKDPRLFYYALPAQNAIKKGLSVDDFDAYSGIDGSLSMPEATELGGTGDYSRIHGPNYTESAIGKPSLAFGYSEFLFILEEAKVRGWINSNIDYFGLAVRTSFNFYGMDAEADSYLIRNRLSKVKEVALNQIYQQKFIYFNNQGDFEPFFEYHRTGFPDIKIGNGQATTSVPYRLMYPLSEQNTNMTNYIQALTNQAVDKDNTMFKPWIYGKVK